jgi:hypothetical protein
MSKFPSPRVTRIASGLAVVSALAVAPMAAQAANSDATGTLTAGALTNTAPGFTPFSATLTGLVQTKNTAVATWGVTDATGSNSGYSVTVSATAPTVDADGAGGADPTIIAGSTLKLYPTGAEAVSSNANTAPVAQAAQQLDVDGTPTASTIQNAPAGSGQGPWSFPADTGATGHGLEVVIPGTATPGAYSSTLSYTTAAPAA